VQINKIHSKGSYILLCELLRDVRLRIGSLGIHDLKKGNYIYIGSALGPGGLCSRICRHLKKNKRVWWHIDYLTTRPECVIRLVIIIPSKNRLECVISKKLYEAGFRAPIHKFGSMDCDCFSHLFLMESIERLKDLLSGLHLDYFIVTRRELMKICFK